jgi:hypothetical protein
LIVYEGSCVTVKKCVPNNKSLSTPFNQINCLGYVVPNAIKKRRFIKMMAILTQSKSKKSFIDHLKKLCSLKYMDQQGWLVLEDATMVGLDEVKDFPTFNDDGTFDAKPMMHHLRMLKRFLLFCNRMIR